MSVEIKELPAMRLAAVQHKGPYNQVGQAFGRLHQIVGPAGLLKHSETKMIGVYHDDPKSTPADQLRSEAGVTVGEDVVTLPEGLTEVRIPAGRYGRTSHVGPYTGLPDAWARLMSWPSKNGQQVDSSRPSLEIYVNTEMDKPEKLVTDLYVPIK